jgi:hypothetical protein
MSEGYILRKERKRKAADNPVRHPPPEVGALKTVDRSKRLVQKNI